MHLLWDDREYHTTQCQVCRILVDFLQAFGQYNVSDITTPVVAVKGTEDDLLGGQASSFFPSFPFSQPIGLSAISPQPFPLSPNP